MTGPSSGPAQSPCAPDCGAVEIPAAICPVRAQRRERRGAHRHRALALALADDRQFPHRPLERAVHRWLQIFPTGRRGFLTPQPRVTHQQDRRAHRAPLQPLDSRLSPSSAHRASSSSRRRRHSSAGNARSIFIALARWIDRRIIDRGPRIAGQIAHVDPPRERSPQRPHRVTLRLARKLPDRKRPPARRMAREALADETRIGAFQEILVRLAVVDPQVTQALPRSTTAHNRKRSSSLVYARSVFG